MKANAGNVRAGNRDRTQTGGNTVLDGTWGGPEIRLDIAESGAKVEFDCAHGTIDQPFKVDKDGHFDLKGSYQSENGGPATNVTPSKENGEAAERNARPAIYSGTVTDNVMKLKIKLVSSDKPIGTFTLKHGSEARIHKCL